MQQKILLLNRYGECDANISEFSVFKAYVMVIGTFTQRAFSHVPSTWKARIAFLRYDS